jgi:pyruvate kinase
MTKLPVKKTKIVATVGPASNTKDMLRQLIMEGVDVFRLNFSHGTHEQHAKVYQTIQELNEELNTHICVLLDLQGPKIRIGEIEGGGMEIKSGDFLEITTEEMIGKDGMVSTTYQGLALDVSLDDMILIDDGKIELRVTEIGSNKVKGLVVHGGLLKPRKGINLPESNVSAPSLTEKDIEDLEFAIKYGVEWVALSFVRSAHDIIDLKRRIKHFGKDIKVIAKIEKPEALKNIDEIIEHSDGLMVARGDLGVEILMEEVPMAQKMIVKKCRENAKPVIIATQIMESMITNPRPTRAETNDIANAIFDGADALMLSAETASGQFPIEVIRSMTRTIQTVEKHGDIYDRFNTIEPTKDTFLNDNLVLTACKLGKEVNAKALIGMTKSGYTAYKLSANRPCANIFIFTANRPLLKTMNLIWGVKGYYYDGTVSTDQTFADIERILVENGHLDKGDVFINTASMPLRAFGRTNMLKLNVVGE